MHIGFWATAGAGGGGGAAAYELISSTILTGSATAVDFTGLSSYAAQYKHLQIRFVSSQPSGSTFQNDLSIQINNVTTASYSRHFLTGNGGSVSSGASTSQTRILLGLANGVAGESSPGVGIIDLYDFSSTTINKTVRVFHGRSGSTTSQISLTSGQLINTAAVTSFKIYAATNDIAAGSRFSLYGVKG